MGAEDKRNPEALVRAIAAGYDAAFRAHLERALAEAADPHTALTRLQTLLNAGFDGARLAQSFPSMRLLVRLLDQSQFVYDIFIRDPDAFRWIAEHVDLATARSAADTVHALTHAAISPGDWNALCRIVRQRYNREMARIAARDLCRHEPVESITEDLANLADGLLTYLADVLIARETERRGAPRMAATGGPAAFTILGLGKLGGRELNFSSDIDLLFLYAGEGETEGGSSRAVSNAEFFSKVGESLIRAMSEQTADCKAFRIDMRLRPHGTRGPLACTLDHALDYYERYGQAWERQALIKARVCGGDSTLGEAFIEGTRSFVFPRYFDDATLEDIRTMKQQMENHIAGKGLTEREVKLGRGGIRDIEFTVQVLQLLNGGRVPEARAPRTLDALTALSEIGELSPLEASTLRSNYIFLRQVEHRLQIDGGQQVHALPESEADRDFLARKLGYASGGAFMNLYRARTDENRAILERFLATRGDGNLWIAELLNPHVEEPAGLERLAAMGFHHPQAARDTLIRLHSGTVERPHALHTRQQFIAAAPALLDAIAACPNPDRALSRLSDVLEKLKAPRAIYEILRQGPEVARYLAQLAANSAYLTAILVRDPGLFDLLGSAAALAEPTRAEDLREQRDALAAAYDRGAALYRLRDGETLRIGLRDVLAGASVFDVGYELTQLADVVVDSALAAAREKTAQRFGPIDIPFCILALGKSGGREMGYGSDLDLVFVYDQPAEAGDVDPAHYATDIAQRTIRTLREATKYGMLYEVDARLRPDGAKGVLVVSRRRFHEYYVHEAESWERLALMKLRYVAGDPGFGQDMERIGREMALSLPLNAETVGRIAEISGRLADSAKPGDLKRGPGGLAQLEFAVRLLQIAHANDLGTAAAPEVAEGIRQLEGVGIIDSARAAQLRESYVLLRRIENRMRMMDGTSTSVLPNESGDREDLTARLQLSQRIEVVVDCAMQSTKTFYSEVIGRYR